MLSFINKQTEQTPLEQTPGPYPAAQNTSTTTLFRAKEATLQNRDPPW